MANLEKYKGVIPAFYACYDAEGNVSPERVRALTEYHIRKGVKGVYVNGSSGECIYQSLEDRKITLENVMAAAKGRLTVIAHVGCNNTKDSVELAKHAESLGVDAIASIPPIYFHLPEYAIAAYWNAMSQAAPNTDFIIYNIPQLAGVALTQSLFAEMRKNPRVIGVKNSSMPVQDIQMFKLAGGDDYIIFNGPDEQFISGRVIGAEAGIGGTYGVMPELFLKMDELVKAGKMEEAMKSYARYDGLAAGREECLKRIGRLKANALRNQEEEARWREQLLKEDNELAALKTAGEDYQAAQSAIEKLAEYRTRVDSLVGELSEYHRERKNLEQAQELYREADETRRRADQVYKSLYQRFLDNQAGILARELVEGSPCPVCGSTVHPAPAGPGQAAGGRNPAAGGRNPADTFPCAYPDCDVTKELVDQAAKDSEARTRTASELSLKAGRLAGSLETRYTRMRQQIDAEVGSWKEAWRERLNQEEDRGDGVTTSLC